MRVVFAGSPLFAAVVLDALAGRHDVRLVLTQPPEPRGRGRSFQPTDVARLAARRGFPCLEPGRLADPVLARTLRACGADVLVVAAYGRLLPASWLGLFPLGAINVHASLLPRWRGASPVAHAILAGDRESGVSIMRMTPRLDDGPVYRRCPEPVREDDTVATLGERLARRGAFCLLEVLDRLADDPCLAAEPQDEARATYAPRLRKEDGHLDWRAPAADLARRVRAFSPWPGTYTFLGRAEPQRRLVVHAAQARDEDARAEPGTVVAAGVPGIGVACGSGLLVLTRLQRSGGPVLDVPDFLRGWRTPLVGQRLL